MRESDSKFPINTRSVLRISAPFVHPDTPSTEEQQEEQQEEPEHTSQESLAEQPVERSEGGEEQNQKVLPSSSSGLKGLLCKHGNITNPNLNVYIFP